MAGDWIKMRADLITHPKVVRMVSALKADKFRVIGGLHSVWCLFDLHSEDGTLDGYTPEVLDTYLGWPGFSAAMIAINWLIDDGASLAVPRFDEHNGQSAKRRAQEASRKREVRKASASDADKMQTREEKRREDIPVVTESSISTSSTAAGEVCARLKSSGIPGVNPQHPKLLALLDAGLSVEEIASVGPEAKEKGKGFPWILATAEGRRRDAAQVGSLPAAQTKPWFVSGSGITAKGEELGLFERDFETFPAFKAAVFKQAGVTDDMVRRAQQDGH